MQLSRHKEYIGRHGVQLWLFEVFCTLSGRAVGLKALRGMTLMQAEVDSMYFEDHERFPCFRGDAAEMAALDPDCKLNPRHFYEGAAERGDWCFYFMDGPNLASYGWYSDVPVPVDDACRISYSPDYVYMYNGYTVPEYRGHRLHAYGMAHALADAVSQGYTGIISYVEAQNAASLKSVARLGYRTFGTCVRAQALGKTILLRSPGCRPYDFKLIPEVRAAAV